MDKNKITDWLDGGCSSWGVPEQNIRAMVNSHDKLVEALRAALEYIDAIPKETVLPGMPGFSRDDVDELLEAL